MQPASDKRMGNMLQKNLSMFQNLCGKDGFRRVVVAKTMWQGNHSGVGVAWEDKLKRDFWPEAAGEGPRTVHFENTRESAWQALEHIIALEMDRMWIQTQAELAAFRKDLEGAGVDRELGDRIEHIVNAQQDIRSRMRRFVTSSSSEAMGAFTHELDEVREKQAKVITDLDFPDSSLPDQLRRWFDGVSESPSRSAQLTSSFLQDRCRNLIPKISENAEQSALICKLSGDEAQNMIDFLNLVRAFTPSLTKMLNLEW